MGKDLAGLTKSHSASERTNAFVFLLTPQESDFSPQETSRRPRLASAERLPSFLPCPNIPTPFASSLPSPPLDFPNEIRACDGLRKMYGPGLFKSQLIVVLLRKWGTALPTSEILYLEIDRHPPWGWVAVCWDRRPWILYTSGIYFFSDLKCHRKSGQERPSSLHLCPSVTEWPPNNPKHGSNFLGAREFMCKKLH